MSIDATVQKEWVDGYRSFRAQTATTANPHERGTPAFEAWENGWITAQAMMGVQRPALVWKASSQASGNLTEAEAPKQLMGGAGGTYIIRRDEWNLFLFLNDEEMLRIPRLGLEIEADQIYFLKRYAEVML